MTMLEYTKMILEKVSFDRNIFRKELKKATHYVSKEEYQHLKDWCKERFSHMVIRKRVLSNRVNMQ
jgi:hypothetical protein